MVNNLSVKYYQKSKERLQKKKKMLVKVIKIFLKEKMKKVAIPLWTR